MNPITKSEGEWKRSIKNSFTTKQIFYNYLTGFCFVDPRMTERQFFYECGSGICYFYIPKFCLQFVAKFRILVMDDASGVFHWTFEDPNLKKRGMRAARVSRLTFYSKEWD